MLPRCDIIAVVVLLSTTGLLLQGCGGGGGNSPTPKPTPAPTPAPTPGPAPPSPPLPRLPIQGVSYNPLPCTKADAEVGGQCNKVGTPKPGMDFVQKGYSAMWGKEGRDDLGTLLRLGANAVRMDSAFGLESKNDHSEFLDRAHELGLHVMLGFHTQMNCPKFDCFNEWKRAATVGLQHGYKSKNGSGWHQAVTMLILADNPDGLNFGGVNPALCAEENGDSEASCRVRAVLSAMDAVLMAEKEMGVKSNVNMTAAWSSDVKSSIDGKVQDGIGIYGFQDMVAGVADPSIANYKLRSSNKEFQQAFKDRWVHSIDSAANWAFIKEKVGDEYEKYNFPPHKWFVAEFKAQGVPNSQLTQDLKSMSEEGKKEGGYFMGANLFQFQNDYTNPSFQEKFGMFGLGNGTFGKTTDVCQEDVTTHTGSCEQWTTYCLQVVNSDNDRAPSVAEAWKGSDTVAVHGLCTKLLSMASMNNTVNSGNLDSRPTSPEQSGVRVIV